LVLGSLISGFAQEASPTPLAPQSDGKTIGEVRITGNLRIPEDTIRGYLRIRVGDPYDEARVRADFDALVSSGLFDDVKVKVAPLGASQVAVIFEVAEKLYIQGVEFVGLKGALEQQLAEHLRSSNLTIHAGSVLDENRISRVERAIGLFLQAKGFPLARVELERQPVPTHAVKLVFHITEGQKVRIGSVTFEGNTIFSERELRNALQFARPTSFLARIKGRDRYVEDYLNYDIQHNILPLYHARGYIFARALPPKVEIVETRKRSLFGPAHSLLEYKITVPLVEGGQYRYGSFAVEGVTKLDPEKVRQAYDIRPGDIVDFPQLSRSNDEVKRLYAEKGFLDMRLIPEIRPNHDARTVDATIRIEEGERYLVRKIDFVGNERTRDKVLRREFQIAEQDPFDIRLLDQSIARLNQLGFLEPITARDYDLKKDRATSEVDVVVHVKEKDEHAINFDGGVWGISGSYLGVNYQSRNFRGLGQLIELQLSPGTRTSIYSASWTDPYWMDTRFTLGLTAYQRRFQFDAGSVLAGQDDSLGLFTQRSTGFEATTSHPVTRWSRAGLAYTLDTNKIYDIQEEFRSYAVNQLVLFTTGGTVEDALNGIVRSQISPFWLYNTRDQIFGATRGTYLFARVPVAGGPFGGRINVGHPFLDARKYFSDTLLSGGRNTWAFRAQLQHVFSYGRLAGGEPSPVPFLERIYLGGEDGLRGFDLRSVGPSAIYRTPQVDAEGRPVVDPSTGEPLFNEQRVAVGGDTAAILSAEYRVPVYGPLQITPFLDAGVSTTLRKKDLRVSGIGNQVELIESTNGVWRMSTGTEIQFLLPVVNQPFRLILAYNPLRLNTRVRVGGEDQEIREPKTNITFTIGYSF
jgi:outer membrane protein insertion porin family